jgi:hypothetical protein
VGNGGSLGPESDGSEGEPLQAARLNGTFTSTAGKTTARTGLRRVVYQHGRQKVPWQLTDLKRSPASSGFGQPAIGEPAAELLRRSDAVIDNCGIDLEAANPIGVAREAKPHVLDPQHCRTLAVGDRVTQCLMPSRDVLVRIAQPQREVEPPRTLALGLRSRERSLRSLKH